MPNLTAHQSKEFTKILVLGDSGSGKTGSLASLVEAGYRLRIIDFDNKLDVLKQFVMRECPDGAHRVDYITLRDAYKMSPIGPVLSGPAKAFPTAMKLLDHWKTDVDLGPPKDWGPECVLVLDSLSRMSDAAYDFSETIMPATKTGQQDSRAVFYNAQTAVETAIATLTSDTFRTNVVVIAHVLYMEMPDGTFKGFPQAVGQKLSPRIPQYFPTTIMFQSKAGKRTIHTVSNALVDLVNPAPFKVEKTYPIETGMAEIFTALQGEPEAKKGKSK